MSAEKTIVNYWLNKKGLFTVSNVKTLSNRNGGILAVEFEGGQAKELLHIEVSCSITSNISDAKDISGSISRIISEKFTDKKVSSLVQKTLRQFSLESGAVKRKIVTGSLPKSRKKEIAESFKSEGVEVIEFGSILFDVLESLDTQYHKDDVIRTLQLTKFLLMKDPAKISKLLCEDYFSSAGRNEFLSSILDEKQIMKEFKKTNKERLGAILKNSGLKSGELAEIVGQNLLTKRTGKSFIESMIKQQGIATSEKRRSRVRKINRPLENFF